MEITKKGVDFAEKGKSLLPGVLIWLVLGAVRLLLEVVLGQEGGIDGSNGKNL